MLLILRHYSYCDVTREGLGTRLDSPSHKLTGSEGIVNAELSAELCRLWIFMGLGDWRQETCLKFFSKSLTIRHTCSEVDLSCRIVGGHCLSKVVRYMEIILKEITYIVNLLE